MSQRIPSETIEYERCVDGLRRQVSRMLAGLKDTRAELQTLFDEDYDYTELDALIAAGEELAMASSKAITIHVEGGVIQDVTGIPPGVEVRVEDYDIAPPPERRGIRRRNAM